MVFAVHGITPRNMLKFSRPCCPLRNASGDYVVEKGVSFRGEQVGKESGGVDIVAH